MDAEGAPPTADAPELPSFGSLCRGALLSLSCALLLLLSGPFNATRFPPRGAPLRPVPPPLPCARPGDITWHQRHCNEDDVWGGCVRLELRGCPAAESAGAVGRCLQRRHVLFLGDSVSRYTFLSLAQFLAQGTWDSDFFPPTEFEGFYRSWREFFEISNARLGADRAFCDCFRRDYTDRWEVRDEQTGENMTAVGSLENRYFFAPGGGRLSFLQVFGEHPLVWHELGALGAAACGAEGGCAQRLCAPAECHPLNTSAVRAGLLDGPAVRAHVAALLPTDIVVNAGLWGSWEGGAEGPLAEKLAAVERLAEAVACARGAALCGVPFAALPRGAAPRLVWRTTTAPAPISLRAFREPRLVAEALRRGWRVVDAGGAGTALRLLISTEGLEVWHDARGTGGWILNNQTPNACAEGGGGACPELRPELEREQGAPELDWRRLWADETHPAPAVTAGLAKLIAGHLCASDFA